MTIFIGPVFRKIEKWPISSHYWKLNSGKEAKWTTGWLQKAFTNTYDAVSDVVESGVHWRSDFQIGSRVLKICFKPILMHIYGMQYDFMHRSCWNHSNFENSWFYNVISTSDPQNHCLLGSRNRVAVNFFNRYVIYWVVPCERARPELSEYVWQRGVGSL